MMIIASFCSSKNWSFDIFPLVSSVFADKMSDIQVSEMSEVSFFDFAYYEINCYSHSIDSKNQIFYDDLSFLQSYKFSPIHLFIFAPQVFHVCALTDDGLVMKSFLCPESTLFDQSILKCNWWFYTDCKNSKSLYDSNLPVSKSYQLMKSLSYFNNNYKAPSSQSQNATKITKENDNHHIEISKLTNDEDIDAAELHHDDEKVSIISAKDAH